MSERERPATADATRRAPSPSLERWLWLAVLAVAAGARLFDLDLKPLHSDESMNGFFLRRLLEEGVYRYRPSDFHGPLLYFASLPPLALAGPSETGLRLATALAGVGVVASLRLYRPWIGAWGALAAGALLACSAPDVYFARTCIHETWFVLALSLAGAFSLRALAAGRRRDFALAGASWACAAASKETVVISGATFAAALLLALHPGLRDGVRAPLAATDLRGLPAWLRRHGGRLALAAGVAAAVVALLFTSFLHHPRGLLAMLEAARPWLEYGLSGRNQARPPGYFAGLWVWWAPVLLPAACGAALGIARRRRFALLALTWFGATLLVYELLPYKTPWCALPIGLPLFPLAGYGVDALAAGGRARAVAALLLMLASLGEGVRASYDANFVRYDDPAIPFVYVQTVAPFMDLVEDVTGLRANRKRAEGAQVETRIFAVEPKNPLRWYLYSRGWPDAWADFQSRWPEPGEERRMRRLRENLASAELVMVAETWERDALARLDAGRFVRRSYPARPGARYVLFVARELARYLPAPDAPRVDGGGDPLARRPPAPPSPLPGP